MAMYKLIGVPLIQQENSFSCWYASVCMVNYCFELGPRLGLPSEYAHSETSGLSNTLWGKLAETEGLRSVLDLEEELWVARRKSVSKGGNGLVLQDLAYLLNKYGPIWTVIAHGRHAVVVTGVESGVDGAVWVYFNDPADAKAKKMSLDDLNQQMDFYDKHVMLCHPQAEYPQRGSSDKTVRLRASMSSVISVQYDVWSLSPGKL